MKKIKIAALSFALIFCTLFLFGCWDSVELDEIFIASAIALDTTENPNELEVSVLVAKTSNAASTADSGGEEKGKSSLIIKSKCQTVIEGLSKINYSSSRALLLQHCQVVLISSSLAEKDLTSILDFFIRDEQIRLEVFIVIVEGKASEVLEINPSQEKSASEYLIGMINDLSKTSKTFKIRILDFMNDYLSTSGVAAVPVLKVEKEGEDEKIKLASMAFLEKGLLKQTIEIENVLAYTWLADEVKSGIIRVENKPRDIVFYVEKIKAEKQINLTQDENLEISYNAKAVLKVGEFSGFEHMSILEFLNQAKKIAKQHIKIEIEKVLSHFKQSGIDAFGFSTTLYKKDPNKWHQIKNKWEEIYKNANINVTVDVRIPSTGQALENVYMEERKSEIR